MEETEKFIEVYGDFKMRKLTENDLEQFNGLLRYAFQITVDELLHTGWTEEQIMHAKKPILKNAYVLGWFYHDKLASMIVVYSMKVNIHDNICSMGGVTGVATYPEYTGKGLIHLLIKKAIEHMHEKGQSISFLYPYSIPLYRKHGWEIISDKITFTIKDSQLPKMRNVKGMMERVSLDCEDLLNVHDYFSMQHHGAMIRDELAWDEYWRWDSDDIIAAIYYNKNHKPLGYLIYYIRNDTFYIKEMVYLNSEARHGIWNYISAHYSMVNEVKGNNYSGEPMAFLFEDSEIIEKIEPYFMARIIDVREFILQYPFLVQSQNFKINLKIKDSIAEWNDGVFNVYWEDEDTFCEKTDDIHAANLVEMDIQTLTTMLMGYKRPTFLYECGRIKTEYYMLRILEQLIPVEKPYFSDYF
jgi:predicted acetyltransferase